MVAAIACDQVGIVEIIAGIKPDPGGQAGAECRLMPLIQQGYLDAIDLAGVFADQPQHEIRGAGDIGAAPIACQRRVEHIPQPMQDHRVARPVDQAAVNAGIDRLIRAHRGKGAAGHQDQLATHSLDRLGLMLIGGQNRIG